MSRKKIERPSGNIVTPYLNKIMEAFDISKNDIASTKTDIYIFDDNSETLKNIFYSEERCNEKNYLDLIYVLEQIALDRKYEGKEKERFNSHLSFLKASIKARYDKSFKTYPFYEETMIAYFEAAPNLNIDELVMIDYLFDDICLLQSKIQNNYVNWLSEYTDENIWYKIIDLATSLLEIQDDCLLPVVTMQISHILKIISARKVGMKPIVEKHYEKILTAETKRGKKEVNGRKKVLDSLKAKIQRHKEKYPSNPFADCYNIYHLITDETRIPLLIACMCLNDKNKRKLNKDIDDLEFNIQYFDGLGALMILPSPDDYYISENKV